MTDMQAFFKKLRPAEQEHNAYMQALAKITQLSLDQIMNISSNLFWDPWGTDPA
jgi:hypothetical protein